MKNERSGFMVKGDYMVPEAQMLAIGAVILHAEEVVDAFDAGCDPMPEDFIDMLACSVMDLRKALRELKALKDGK